MTLTGIDDDDQQRLFLASVKIGLLLLTGLSVHRSLSPPNPSVKSEECCSGTEGTETLFERLVQSITYCSKCMAWFGVFCDTMCIVVRLFSASTVLTGLQGEWMEYSAEGAVDAGVECIPTMMIVGTVFSVVSAVLRSWCFACLGPFFTFEITIRPKHRLIQHGPYSWVRHPSYTGVYLTLTGATLVLAAPGSWMMEYGIKSIFGCLIGLVWVMKCIFAFKGMVVRCKAEDEVLKETFGAQWEDYAARVPNKFLPGLL